MPPKSKILGSIKGTLSDCRSMLRYHQLSSCPEGLILRKMQEQKSIFIHIPKTGGKSILTSLYEINLHEGFGHASIAFYQGIFTTKVFKDCFKFAYVRNPWDRLYSAYRFAIDGGFGLPTDLKLQAEIKEASGSSFSTFVKHWLPKQNIDNLVIFRPQYAFVCDPHDNVLLDRVCYFEHFKREYSVIQKRFGFAKKLNHINRSQRFNAYADAYDEEMKAIVAEIYQKDIEIFGYTFTSNHFLSDHPSQQAC